MLTRTTIAGFEAVLDHVEVNGERVALWRVADLERYVDRQGLLAADDAPEPPYWAHLWSGAVVLARTIPAGACRVLELGCGLGLPGLVAARRGAHVVFVDRVAAPLAFVRASLASGGAQGTVLVADAVVPALQVRFDLVLVAELLYDRSAFAPLTRALHGSLAAGGRALLTDARRIDTSEFYGALADAGLAYRAQDVEIREEGLPVRVRLVEIAVAGAGSPATRGG